MSDQKTIAVEIHDFTATLTLNRPEAMNAFSPAMIADMNAVFDELERRRDVRVCIVTGAGKAFCAGADLKFIGGEGGRATFAAFVGDLSALFSRIERFPHPVIAAVNGLALAGGLELVLCCDLVIAAQDAKFGDAHANYGLLPGAGGSVRLPRKVPVNVAKYMMYTGEFLPAPVMAAAGLVNRTVPRERLMDDARELANALAQKSAAGLARMKSLIDDGLSMNPDAALAMELDAITRHAATPDMHEGLAAFQEGRRPKFNADR